MISVSTVAYGARGALHSWGVDTSHAHMLELLASSIGYGTYAALKLDASVDRDNLFPEAEHVVLQTEAVQKRLGQLGQDGRLNKVVCQAICDAFVREAQAREGPCQFHASMDDFRDFIFEDVQQQAFADSDVADAYAETNAYIDEFYTSDYEFEPLARADEEWMLIASGTHDGEIDQDRPYSGHAGNFTATYTYRKDGRCGLLLLDLEFSLDLDRGYDQDGDE